MKNIIEEESVANSDFEEGEIPEFDICQNDDSGREDKGNKVSKNEQPSGATVDLMRDSVPVRIPSPSQAGLIKNYIYFLVENGRYEVPSVEGEYVSDVPKPVSRNQVPQNTFYDHNLSERRFKYLHPFQTTYGSVEHIMSKIGETLGRSNDCYYKGRRSNDPRSVIKLNSNIGAKFRESGSLFRRLRNSYHKRRRYSRSNSDSDREVWDTKLKNRNPIDLRRREEKDFKKKRKSKRNDFIPPDGETKKQKVPEKIENDSGSTKSNFVGNERLLKAIREMQKRERERAKVPLADNNSKAISNLDPTSVDEEKDKSTLPSCAAVNSDDNQENRNYEDFSEKSSANEDSDDDVELIKLRLLALTSNKRKSQSLNGPEEKVNEDPKAGLTDDEKDPDNSQSQGDVITCKNNQDNDIDRYELMLRAEALTTALLRKHKHGIKKHKYSISNGRDEDGQKLSEKHNLILAEEGEKKTGDEKISFSIAIDHNLVSESVSKSEDISESHAISESTLDNPESPDSVEKYVVSHFTGETDSKGAENCTEDASPTVKKLKRKRLKKSRKFVQLNLSEISIKENSGVPVEDDQKGKDLLPDTVNQKKGLKECEKKSVLVDSSQLSKFQSTDGTKLSLNLEQTGKNSVTDKPNDLVTATSAPKIPKTDIQRIIVHLGSDSSDEEATSQHHQKKDTTASSKELENVEPPCATSADAHSQIVNYEKSVELLLKDARRRIERNQEAPERVPPTPEAVYHHLAPSQRLEYIRLKQKIAETEKLKRMKEKKLESNESPRKNQLKNMRQRASSRPEIQNTQISMSKVYSSGRSLFSKTISKESTAFVGKSSNPSSIYKRNKENKNNPRISLAQVNKDGIRSGRDGVSTGKSEDLKGKTSGKSGNSANIVKNILERKKTLTQNRLHLEKLKILWKKIKVEKMIEDKCKNELKRLKIRQNFYELKVSQQRTKIKKLAEESKEIYEAFQKMNRGLEMIGKRKKSCVVEKNGSEIAEIGGGSVGGQCPQVETVGNVDDVPVEPKNGEGNSVQKISSAKNLDEHSLCCSRRTLPPPHLNTNNTQSKTFLFLSSFNLIHFLELPFNRLVCHIDGLVNVEDSEQVKKGVSSISRNASDQLKEYDSPLQRPTTGSESVTCQRVDPNAIMCQYDLTGRCNDEECPYQHLRT